MSSQYYRMHTKNLRQQSGDDKAVFDKTKYISVIPVKILDLVPGEDEKTLYTRITLSNMIEHPLSEDLQGENELLPEPYLTLFHKRLERQRKLLLHNIDDKDKSPSNILSIFERFVKNDKNDNIKEKELLLLQTYLEIDNSVLNPFVTDRNGATKCMENMPINSYLIRPSSISDSEIAIVRVISVKKENGVNHFLTTAIAGLGYIWFSCDVDNFRKYGMITENDLRPIQVFSCHASFIEMLDYLSKRFSFDLDNMIRIGCVDDRYGMMK